MPWMVVLGGGKGSSEAALEEVRPAGSGLGADAGPEAGAGGAEPGVAAQWLRRVLTFGLWKN